MTALALIIILPALVAFALYIVFRVLGLGLAIVVLNVVQTIEESMKNDL